MPLLFVALSVLTVMAMGAAKATSTTPPLSGGSRVTMKPGEIWAVAGSRSDTPTDSMWEAFHTKLADVMATMGARIGKMTYSGSSFAFQVQPITGEVFLQVPTVDGQFTITKAEKLATGTKISGRGGGGHHGGGHRHGGHRGLRIRSGYPLALLDCPPEWLQLVDGEEVCSPLIVRARRRLG